MNNSSEYVLDRVFDAPRDMVWRVWTDPKLLERWYGAGVETVIHKHELKPGGQWRNEMKWGEKSDFSKMVFQEVTPHEKLIWHHSPADSNWDTAVNSTMSDWPRILLTTVTLEENGDKTNVRQTIMPVDASVAEKAFFEQAMAGMNHCWDSGYAIVDELLAGLHT